MSAHATTLTAHGGSEALAALQRDLAAHLRGAGVGVQDVLRMALAVDELVGNVQRYGFDDGTTPEVVLDVEVGDLQVALRLEDGGRPFDPTAHATREPAASLDAASVGGRGIMLVRSMVGELRYERDGERNVLHLTMARGTATS